MLHINILPRRRISRSGTRTIPSNLIRFIVALAAVLLVPGVVKADEGGVSFWVPGFFGSLAAAPQQPGWSLATVYFHTTVSAGADVAFSREFQTSRLPANLTANLNASASL